MPLNIDDANMTSDATPHTAHREDGAWRVSWLPGRNLTRDQAITAMTIAETAADLSGPLALAVDGWAAELGLMGPEAVALASREPVTEPEPAAPADLGAMLAALIASGREVMFTEAEAGGGQVDAYVMLNSATTVGTGPDPAAALAAAWPEGVELPGPACACGHGYRDHAIRLLDRSRSSCTTECGCRVYAPAGPETAAAGPEGIEVPGSRDCRACGHHAAEHSNIVSGECLADGCPCARLWLPGGAR